MRNILILFLLILVMPCWTQEFKASALHSHARVGFSEMPFFDELQKIQRSLLVWYPIDEDSKVFPSSNPWDPFYVGINAPLKQGQKLPVIAISHSWSGDPHDLSWLIRELVNAGFIVIGIQHRDIINGKKHINHWMRPQDISVILDYFTTTSIASSANLNKIGIVGFSLGGTTALWLAGGRTTKLNSLTPGPEFAAPNDFKNVHELVPDLNKKKMLGNWKDPRIKAAFIMAPAWSWIFEEESLKAINIPIYIVAGERDEVVKTSLNARLFATYIPNCIYQEIPGKVGHFVFLTALSSQKRAIADPFGKLRSVLDDDESVDRSWIQSKVASEAIRFFQTALKES